MNNKQKVLKTLKDFGRLPTARISAIIGMNYNSAVKLLQEMWEAKEIIGEPETNATYWKLKEDLNAPEGADGFNDKNG